MEEKNSQKALYDLAAEVMELSRNTLLVDWRFLDVALSKLTLSPSEKTASLMTDGETLFYAPRHILRSYKADPKSPALQ